MKEIKINNVNETIYYDKCDNGLEIYMWVNENVNEYYATLNVKYGSIDTKFKVKNNVYELPNGVAHFLEHINFNEKDGKTAQDYFDKMGSSINAFTTFDFTSYEVYGTNKIIDNVNHLLDYVETPVITKDLVNKERGIILEEVKMGDNNPSKQLYFSTNQIVFHKNKRIYEVTGNAKDVESITTENLKLAYNTFYHPENMFLIVTGNFNPYELTAAIKENQNQKNFVKFANPKVIQDKEDLDIVKDYQEITGNIEIPKVNMVYKLARKSFKNIDDNNLRIYLSAILNANFGPTSDLKEELMEKELITGIGTSRIKVDDIILIYISFESKYPHEVIKIIKNQMNNLTITKERLERRIKCNISSLITGFDNIEFINGNIQDELITDKKLNIDIYNLYKNVNLETAKKIIQSIKLDNLAILVQNPQKNTSSTKS